MILIDNNILSTFARVDQLELLFLLFPKDSLGVPPAVYDELTEAVRLGCRFLEPAAELITQGRLQIVPLTATEIAAKCKLPASFGAGDADCVIIAQQRGTPLLTNDRRVRNSCREQGLTVFDLPQLLRALWENGILSRNRVRRLTDEMEVAENLVIRNKAAIFEPPPNEKRKRRR
jgi:predicted nucleic acid-binding protein